MFPQSKAVNFLQTTSVTNAGTATSQNLDCTGFDFVSIDIIQTTSNALTNKPSVLKLQDCDTTVSTSFADISGFIGGTDFTIPNVGTDTATIQTMKFNVDTRHRKRYIRLLISPVTTQSFTAMANLHRGERIPVNATDAGVAVLVAG
jgi:hypothetical protein